MELIFILFVLLILLAIMTVVGHVIWVIVREILRWTFDFGSSSSERPPSISFTGPPPPPPNPRAEVFKDLAATERQIVKFYTDGKINDETYENLLARIREERENLTYRPQPQP